MENASRTSNQLGRTLGRVVQEEQDSGEGMKGRSGQANAKIMEAAVCQMQSEVRRQGWHLPDEKDFRRWLRQDDKAG